MAANFACGDGKLRSLPNQEDRISSGNDTSDNQRGVLAKAVPNDSARPDTLQGRFEPRQW